MTKNVTPTLVTYNEWQTAYDFFNRELFDGRLPECIITLDNKGKRIGGYFAANRYANTEGETKDGLAMNPWYFHRRELIEVLSYFVHEMCHVWLQHHGKRKSPRTYHNKEWGERMRHVGLMPSNTGMPGGAETGQQMGHYIIKGGPFEESCKRLLGDLRSTEEFKISWAEAVAGMGVASKASDRNKNKYICGECRTAVWGKPNLYIVCGTCNADFSPAKTSNRAV